MFFADQPAVVAPSEQPGLIEVVGTRRDQAQKIDRRIYRVRHGPESAQADTLQLLRGLPAVIVTPDDQVLLLGNPNVEILIDEKPLYGSRIQYLRTLRGSDIERIEVITNPSAQFSAAGTGGIINIVLRRMQDDGLSGSGSVQLSSLGKADGSGTFKRKSGDWTYEGQAQALAGTDRRSTYRKLRTVHVPGGAPTVNTEEGGGSATSRGANVSGKATYDIDAKTSVSAALFGNISRGRAGNDAEFRGLTGDFESFSERQRHRNQGGILGSQLALDRKGPRDGQTLMASARLIWDPRSRGTISAVFDDGRAYAVERESRSVSADAKVDWTRPIGRSRILSVGSVWVLQDSVRGYRLESHGKGAGPSTDAADEFASRTSLLAAYATFQQRLGDWTVMPGFRVERISREIASAGRPDVDIERTSVFPTFHLERPLGSKVTMTWSYSKRIDRPDSEMLRPYRVFLGGLAAEEGNPELRDQTTDAYEVNLHYRHKSLDVGLIIYNRETERLWATDYFVDEQGLNVTTQVNAGHKTDRGAQFDVSTPLLPRVKATASINLFDSRFPVDPLVSSERERSFRYSGNATVEWRGASRGETPGPVGQVQMEYSSPRQGFQQRYDATYSINLSWTHSFSSKWAVTGMLNGIGSDEYRHRLFAPLVQEEYRKWERQPEFKLKLVRIIGSAN